MKKKTLWLFLFLTNLVSYAQITLNEGFEVPATPAGWTYSRFARITNSNGYPCTGGGALLSNLIYDIGSSATASMVYSSNNSNGNQILVSFKYRPEEGNSSNPIVTGIINVEYSNNNGSTYNLIGSPISVTGSTTCSTFTGTIPTGAVPAGTNFKFRITGKNSGSGYWIMTIDDVILLQAATCSVPSGLSMSNITSTGAQVNWSSTNTPTNGYDVYYSTINTSPTSLTTPSITGISATSVNIGPLLSNEAYYIWVRSNCGSNISSWSNVQTFSTPCGIYILPYNENFETTTLSTIPVCTTQQNGTWWSYPVESGIGFNQGRALAYNFSNSLTTNTWWYTPPFNLQGGVTYALKFKRGNRNINAGNTQRLKVAFGTSANSSAMTNIIKDFSDPIISNSISEVLYFTPSANGIYNLGFNGYTSLGVSGYENLLIDDIVIEQASNCKTPGNITISSITQTTATVNWDASISNPAEGYDLYYSTNDTQPTSGTVPTYQGIFGLSKDLSSLLVGRNYYIWVRSRCSSSEFSDWKQAIFSTTCAISTIVPYTENFENSFSGSLPLCTSVENTSTGTNWIIHNYYQASDFWPGGKTLYLFFNSTTIPNSSWFYTQGIYLEQGKQYKMNYLYGDRNTTGAGPVKLKVAYGVTPNSASMTSILSDHQTMPNQDQNSAQRTFTVPSTGIYYFGFNGYSVGAINFIAVDNITIIEDNILVVEDVNKKDNIAIYPNPFNDKLNIINIKDVKSITINDISGKLVKSLFPEKELNVQDLNDGIYIVSLKYKDGTIKTFRVVKK
ncbi:T9SS C-terminal target domain-containing protein [Chryseobacterium carnipullorum]|uniref:T9SS C-terminal target domain-containing protein n=1 Tax=Chryseobacterium carnipullorum TaxID=1124835 RepID=A0A3G6MDG5_CHRCU|nr:fibronectin type III domain-containing protein [Chryseobacterium carnipullorum]AZA50989.1 T9SS C-terminal target domain-containing protein [Chryseobacterium carnipullorum]AZA65851.1 T9SS C-terminal target domain-containing protein [Chryseobacterium carnipullorum]